MDQLFLIQYKFLEIMQNTLYFGDNLAIIRQFIKDETINLIYLDPPFNSKANYNVIFKTKNKEDSPSQIQAFEDTWKWNSTTEFELHQLFGSEPKLAELMKGLELIIGKNDLLAYLVMMAIRLRELYRVLKDTGSLYLHCDPTASHYLKLILDSIFSSENFQNEIIWQKIRVQKSQTKGFGSVHDVILVYRKTSQSIFNIQYVPHSEKYIKSHWNQKDKNGRRYRLIALDQQGSGPSRIFNDVSIKPPPGKHWVWSQDRINDGLKNNIIVFTKNGTPRIKKYLDQMKGNIITDLWIDITPLNAVSKERMGYPTQKPVALLERIIKASSNENDIVLDPFCGCGTAIVAAQRLNRNWIGMDITHLAIGLMEKRIYNEFKIKPKVIGNPASFIGAENLFKRSPLDFERWAVTRIDGIHPNDKQVGDHGIDGRGYLGPDNQYKTIISVKGGKQLNPGMVRDLEGTVSRENAAFGVLITIHNPTDGMKQEAAKAGVVNTPLGHHYPKIQIYTISDYFNARKAELP